ncbi:DUF1080 domain-containing protein [Sphingomonas sp. C8-2]|nr:DUF1080 domain-containing protein [Sphingomonas sp. C8-2]
MGLLSLSRKWRRGSRAARASCALAALAALGNAAPEASGWRPLFNGHDLDGWVAKINHHPLGDNAHGTFVASDGVLHVRYDGYRSFFDEFAHLIYRQPFSSYRLRFDYRFVGVDTPGGPPWSKRNSGVMIYGQAPETIGRDQPFPISIEIQLLNGEGADQRTTGNICTPGTNVAVGGQRVTSHCVLSVSRPYAGEGWVHVEIEVRSGGPTIVEVDGVEVIRFDKPELDPTDLTAMPLYLAGGARSVGLTSGYISLQGEGHPIDFRRIEILELAGDAP